MRHSKSNDCPKPLDRFALASKSLLDGSLWRQVPQIDITSFKKKEIATLDRYAHRMTGVRGVSVLLPFHGAPSVLTTALTKFLPYATDVVLPSVGPDEIFESLNLAHLESIRLQQILQPYRPSAAEPIGQFMSGMLFLKTHKFPRLRRLDIGDRPFGDFLSLCPLFSNSFPNIEYLSIALPPLQSATPGVALAPYGSYQAAVTVSTAEYDQKCVEEIRSVVLGSKIRRLNFDNLAPSLGPPRTCLLDVLEGGGWRNVDQSLLQAVGLPLDAVSFFRNQRIWDVCFTFFTNYDDLDHLFDMSYADDLGRIEALRRYVRQCSSADDFSWAWKRLETTIKKLRGQWRAPCYRETATSAIKTLSEFFAMVPNSPACLTFGQYKSGASTVSANFGYGAATTVSANLGYGAAATSAYSTNPFVSAPSLPDYNTASMILTKQTATQSTGGKASPRGTAATTASFSVSASQLLAFVYEILETVPLKELIPSEEVGLSLESPPFWKLIDHIPEEKLEQFEIPQALCFRFALKSLQSPQMVFEPRGFKRLFMQLPQFAEILTDKGDLLKVSSCLSQMVIVNPESPEVISLLSILQRRVAETGIRIGLLNLWPEHIIVKAVASSECRLRIAKIFFDFYQLLLVPRSPSLALMADVATVHDMKEMFVVHVRHFEGREWSEHDEARFIDWLWRHHFSIAVNEPREERLVPWTLKYFPSKLPDLWITIICSGSLLSTNATKLLRLVLQHLPRDHPNRQELEKEAEDIDTDDGDGIWLHGTY